MMLTCDQEVTIHSYHAPAPARAGQAFAQPEQAQTRGPGREQGCPAPAHQRAAEHAQYGERLKAHVLHAAGGGGHQPAQEADSQPGG